MKFIKKALALVAVIMMPSYAFSESLGLMRLSLLQGDVQMYSKDTESWVPASINMPLDADYRLWVPHDGKAEIQVKGGAYIRLNENTAFDVLNIGEEDAQVYLGEGRAYINTKRRGISHIQMDTPLSSVDIRENSVVMVDVSVEGSTDISVLKGYAYAESRSGSTRVMSGNTIHIGEDMTAELFPIGSPDDWEKWNRRRDKDLYEERESARYLPDELTEYSYDFDENGRWTYEADYGYVWVPRVTLYNWSPYRLGRWVWMSGIYVWISYEPWGWAPYHYGRWTHVSRIGWCWVPPSRGAVYWGPGYVGWVYTPTYVAWVPLAPGDIYYGYGYYGPGSVNIIVQKNVIVQKFININAKNAVTLIHRDTFIDGKTRTIKVRENPFMGPLRAGPPDIKPEKTTTMPLIKPISSFKQPPEKVKSLSTETVKKERVLLKEKTGTSVFAPGQPAQSMPIIKKTEPARIFGKPHERIQPKIEKEKISPPRTSIAPSKTVPEEPKKKETVTTTPVSPKTIIQKEPSKPVEEGKKEAVTTPRRTPQKETAPEVEPVQKKTMEIRREGVIEQNTYAPKEKSSAIKGVGGKQKSTEEEDEEKPPAKK